MQARNFLEVAGLVVLLLSSMTTPTEALLSSLKSCDNMNRSTTTSVNAVPKLVLLDRDGVINQDVGAPGVVRPSQLLLTPGAGKAIGKLQQAGCRVVMITNQSCVGKGLITVDELQIIQDKVQQLLYDECADATIDRIYQCTSTKEQQDLRMKPQPGMILEAMADFQVSPEDCCLVGDTSTDLQAAAAAGIQQRLLVATGYGSSLMQREHEIFEKSNRYISYQLVTPQQSSNFPKIVPDAFPFTYCSNLATAAELVLDGSLRSAEEIN